ncbi:SAM-dependent methyltransferase [Propionigenium maris DSM 9537]|uniref:SAM-dependent methyltransferase n=1 Tax=Propionigenium maris DSM 9537 TaxID=1123000 RepID=A0A9W6GNW7_9FUSO|nr:class I SAM-dependent methyltransferase [Propionigenium maris]GLI57236.1 SAM-dependent methyltransferase [Propionigenium maris DSM 9537]
MNKLSLESYEKMADDYAEYVDNKPWNADYERPATLSLVGEVRGEKILDAGCAAGWYSKKFLEMEARGVVGLDFSPEMIKIANHRLKGEVKGSYNFYCHDLNERMDYLQDKTFDKVVSSLTLHYLEDWSTALNEFNRVLKDEGKLVISIHHPFMEYLVFEKEDYFRRELTTDIWNMNGREVEVRFYTRPLHEVINSITGAGFLIEEILEPMPTLKFKEKNSKAYETLTKRPQFLFIKAIKNR